MLHWKLVQTIRLIADLSMPANEHASAKPRKQPAETSREGPAAREQPAAATTGGISGNPPPEGPGAATTRNETNRVHMRKNTDHKEQLVFIRLAQKNGK